MQTVVQIGLKYLQMADKKNRGKQPGDYSKKNIEKLNLYLQAKAALQEQTESSKQYLMLVKKDKHHDK